MKSVFMLVLANYKKIQDIGIEHMLAKFHIFNQEKVDEFLKYVEDLSWGVDRQMDLSNQEG